MQTDLDYNKRNNRNQSRLACRIYDTGEHLLEKRRGHREDLEGHFHQEGLQDHFRLEGLEDHFHLGNHHHLENHLEESRMGRLDLENPVDCRYSATDLCRHYIHQDLYRGSLGLRSCTLPWGQELP